MTEKIAKIKKHVHTNRAKYAVAATLTVVAIIDRARVKEWNSFLSEHNLLETYYNPVEE